MLLDAEDVPEALVPADPDEPDVPVDDEPALVGLVAVAVAAEVDEEWEADEVAVVEGSVVWMALGGRLVLVEGSVVLCGGSVFELVATAEVPPVPTIVNVGLMLPESPNTEERASVGFGAGRA